MSEPVLPAELDGLPGEIVRRFDGSDVANADVVQLLTVDHEMWPHEALLGAGEILCVDARRLRLLLWPHARTAANMMASGRALLGMIHRGGRLEARLRVRATEGLVAGCIAFDADVERVRLHVAPYARIVSGIRFELDAAIAPETIARWREQVDALRA